MKMLKSKLWMMALAAILVYFTSCNTQDEVAPQSSVDAPEAYQGESYSRCTDAIQIGSKSACLNIPIKNVQLPADIIILSPKVKTIVCTVSGEKHYFRTENRQRILIPGNGTATIVAKP